MSLDQTLRRHFWVVPLPLVAGVALLNAQAVMQLVGVAIDVDAKDLAKPPLSALRAAPSASAARVVSADPILKRNPFDSVTGSLVAPPPSSGDGSSDSSSDRVDTSDPFSAPACDGVDVNAIAASDDVDWSFASISGSDKKSHLLRRGGEISGKKVHFIGWDRLWLAGDGSLCQAQLFAKKAAPPPTTPTPAPAPSTSSSRPSTASRAKPLDADLRKGIQKVSDTEYNIDRGVVDKILENQADLMRQARITPVQENGRVVGVRLMGIRQDALLGVLGMQNGDRLQTINGFEMASPEKALEAYARLRTAEKLTIQINRGGKNMNLDYNIK